MSDLLSTRQFTLITGATSSFGRAFAMIFAKEGFNLVLVDTEASALLQLESDVRNLYPHTITSIIPKDLSVLTAAQELYDEIVEEGIIISILVNNSGVSEVGLFAESSWEREQSLIMTQVMTTTHLTKLFLRDMLVRDNGKILQVASVSAFMPTPRMAVYGASKSFMLFFSEALQHELRDKNITVTILSPGATQSDAFRKASTDVTSESSQDDYTDPDDVAQAGYDALMQGKKHEIIGFQNELQLGLSKLMPDSWSAAALNKMFEDRERGH
ncbi:SDR family NAD(P)-dependent oxidoreductase [Pseudochryseolinea flava]|uniref:Short-chain dehydrogenase n=1 Tax=Pseudochryseolinea flava TaxID=2059302 RepID=A0A364XZQ0_9BACT|nr:SDR family NAD(P)-dependent oxidoreductase [Pseudochryseolinea flava]RAV99102.1 hypothetical protein DQQ10_21135 [Pseudochryseolinea flava]